MDSLFHLRFFPLEATFVLGRPLHYIAYVNFKPKKKSRDGNGTTDRSLESAGVRALEAEGTEFTGGN